LPGQELDDADAAFTEIAAFAALGGQAVVHWTPWGMGRRADALADLSRRSGVHVVSATGLHQTRHYEPAVLKAVLGRLAELFVRELTEGAPRAGLIKVAGAFHHLDEHARHVIAAAAQAHHATDAPIGVHLEGGTSALDALHLLCDVHGVPPDRVLLGHMHRFPDPEIHRQVAAAGAVVVLDGPSRAHHATDWRLLGAIAALVEAGYAEQVLLGGDTVTAAARSTADGPGMPFLLSGLRPRIERELGPEAADAIFVRNPARAFAANWPG
jgi:phosphotriesterase-related protein